MELVMIAITACLINNVVLSQFLGICPFLGVSQKSESASGMGMAVTFVITLSSLVCGVIYKFLLIPLHVEYLKTIAFILIVAMLVQFVEMFTKKSMPALYESLGIYLPLITTNCAVLGVALNNVQDGYNFIQSVASGFGTALGYTIAIVLLAGIRSRINEKDLPAPLRGAPIVMIAAALMSIAFMGFGGLVL